MSQTMRARNVARVLQHPTVQGVDVLASSGEIDLISEVVTNRRDYMSDRVNRLVISSLPNSVRLVLEVAGDRIERQTHSAHPGIAVIATVALSNGASLLATDPDILQIAELKSQLFTLATTPGVDEYAIDEAYNTLSDWKVFADMSSGGSRLQLNYVTRDTRAKIERIRGNLGIKSGVLATLCICKCLADQSFLTRERSKRISAMLDNLFRRLKYRTPHVKSIIGTIDKRG